MKRKSQLNLPAHVTEMDSQVENLSSDVPFADGVDTTTMTAGDPNPMFVTVEVLNPQVSRNKNKWTEELLYDVADQINAKKPDGFMGHLSPEELAHKAPEVQTMWLGAKVIERDGVKRLYAKGYVLPYAEKLRSYLKTAKSASKKVTVSVSGVATKVYNAIKDINEITNFKLESIDWTRNFSEGVAGLGAFVLTSEMQSDQLTDQEANMDKSEIIAEMTEKELKKHNPDLYQSIQEQAKAPVESSLTEMQTTVVAPLQEQLEVANTAKEQAETKAQALSGRLTEMVLDRELGKRVDNKAARMVIKRLVVTEMENPDNEPKPEDIKEGETAEEAVVEMVLGKVLSSDEGKAVIAEMQTHVSPAVDQTPSDKSKYIVIN